MVLVPFAAETHPTGQHWYPSARLSNSANSRNCPLYANCFRLEQGGRRLRQTTTLLAVPGVRPRELTARISWPGLLLTACHLKSDLLRVPLRTTPPTLPTHPDATRRVQEGGGSKVTRV